MGLNGHHLMQTFNKLRIDIGNVDVNLFHSWFDADYVEIEEFLSWMCLNLNGNNVLYATEQEEFNKIVNQNKNLEGNDYEQALRDLEIEYPDILAQKTNEFEIEFQEELKTTLLKEEKEQNEIIEAYQDLNTKLDYQIKEQNDQFLKLSAEKQNLKQNCMLLCKELDGINLQLYSQHLKYYEYLHNIDDPLTPPFISNIPMNELNEFHINLISYFESFLMKTQDMSESSKDFLRICDSSPDHVKDKLEERIFQSLSSGCLMKLKEKEYDRKIKYLKTLNVNDLNINSFNSQFLLEANINSTKERLCLKLNELELTYKKVFKNFRDGLSLQSLLAKLEMLREKSDNYETLNKILDEICSYHVLITSLCKKESENLDKTKQFFIDLHSHVYNNLYPLDVKIQLMLEAKSDSTKDYKIPVEDYFRIIVYFGILMNKNKKCNLENIFNSMTKIRNEWKTSYANIIEEYNKAVKKFVLIDGKKIDAAKSLLQSSTTNQLEVAPYEVQKSFEEAFEQVSIFKNTINSLADSFRKTQTKLNSDKWFKIHRTLWVYFLTDPNKMMDFISELKQKSQQN